MARRERTRTDGSGHLGEDRWATAGRRLFARAQVIEIGFLRRLFGLEPRPTESAAPPWAPADDEGSADDTPAPPPVACPNCAVILNPPPTHTRLCPRCRHRIVVRRVDGRTVYLTEAAVQVFEAERRRDARALELARDRRRWLQLAQLTGAPLDRRRRLAAAPLSDTSVEAARALYLTAAERAVRSARQEKRWDDVARIRRRQASALFAEEGATAPPAAETLALHREGVAATLRAIALISREAELVGAACCAECRADGGRIYRVADELRTPRIPHPDCPRGLCACDWWPALRDPTKKRHRRARPTVAATSDPGTGDPDGDPGVDVGTPTR